MIQVRSRLKEIHRTNRIGWLRAAVLGANDGIVSTASLIVGVAASHASQGSVLIAAVAGLVAGAMSMAAGEYVSVSSQSDTERADLAREREELAKDNENEHKELAAIYIGRGLDPALAKQVAAQLMDHDALAAHAQEELGIAVISTVRPVQAALASAAAFTAGGALPFLVVLVTPERILVGSIFGTTLICLAGLGTLAALVGGAPILKSAVRVTFWGALAMGVTAAVGEIFGTIV